MAASSDEKIIIKSASQLLKLRSKTVNKETIEEEIIKKRDTNTVSEFDTTYSLDEASENVLKAAEQAEANISFNEDEIQKKKQTVWVKIVTPNISDNVLYKPVSYQTVNLSVSNEDIPEYVSERKSRNMLKSGEVHTIDFINENIESAQSPEIPAELSYMISTLKMDKDVVKSHVDLFSSDIPCEEYGKTKIKHLVKRSFMGNCRHCHEKITSLTEMSTHMRSNHKDIDYKPWACPVCNYGCPARSTLVKHMNVHCHRKLFECPECGKGFNFKQKLQQHMKYHLNVRDQQCTLCDMAFHELKTLKTHLLHVHNLDRRSSKRGGWVKPEYFTLEGELITSDQLDKMRDTTNKLNDDSIHHIEQIKPMEENDDVTVELKSSSLDYNKFPTSRCVKLRGAVKTNKYTKGYKEGRINKDTSQKKHPIVVNEVTMNSILDDSFRGLDDDGIQKIDNKQNDGAGKFSIEIVTDDFIEKMPPTKNDEEVNIVEFGDEKEFNKKVKRKGSNKKDSKNNKKVKVVEIDNENEITVQIDAPNLDVSEVVVREDNDGNTVLHLNEDADEVKSIKEESQLKVKHSQILGNEKQASRMPRNKGKMTTFEEYVPDLVDYCVMVEQPSNSGQHVRIMYMCKFCVAFSESTNNLYRNVSLILDHINAEHPDVKPWQCNRCDFMCKIRADLISHLQMHASSNEVSCTLCLKKFETKKQLTVHMDQHTKSNNTILAFTCDLCNHSFANETEIDIHTKRVHAIARPFKCKQCGKRYPDEAYLKRHAATHATTKNYMCQYCHKYYRTPMSLNQHMKSHTCLFHCEICNRAFGSYSGFMAHKVMHDQTGSERGFECSVCNKKLLTKGSLVRHLTVAHSTRRPYNCDDCRKSFKTKKDLKNHQIVHDNGKVLQCSVCSFMTKRFITMKLHMKRHDEDTVNKVQVNEFVVENQDQVEDNADLEDDEIEITSLNLCSKCNVAFLNEKDLQYHDCRYVEKPSCEMCNETFRSQDELAGHVLAHHLHNPSEGLPSKVKQVAVAKDEDVIIEQVEEGDNQYVINYDDTTINN